MLRGGGLRDHAAGNEVLHAVRAGDAHLIGAVSVKIQRKGCRRMAQILLHGLDVVSGAEGIDCVGVPQVVDPDAGMLSDFTIRLKQSYSARNDV